MLEYAVDRSGGPVLLAVRPWFDRVVKYPIFRSLGTRPQVKGSAASWQWNCAMDPDTPASAPSVAVQVQTTFLIPGGADS